MITLWIEGYATNGERSRAFVIGDFDAVAIDEAVQQFLDSPEYSPDKYGHHRLDEEGSHLLWGRQIFDNEDDARKSFG